MTVRRTWAIVLAAVAGAVGMLGLGLVLGERSDAVAWAAGPAVDAAGEVLLSTTPLGDDRVVVCVVHTGRNRLMVYEADAGRSRLRLLAVRDISADWALDDYNNDAPLPRDIRQRVQQWKESTGGAETPKPAP